MKALSALATLCIALAISACAPVYTTHYTLNPPQNPQQQVCTTNCALSNTTCLANCRQFAAQCEFASSGGFYRGYDDGGYGRPFNSYQGSALGAGISPGCNSQNCEANCNATARACHTDCGGTITTQQVCTAFCDQPGSPPPPVPPAPGTVPVN